MKMEFGYDFVSWNYSKSGKIPGNMSSVAIMSGPTWLHAGLDLNGIGSRRSSGYRQGWDPNRVKVQDRRCLIYLSTCSSSYFDM